MSIMRYFLKYLPGLPSRASLVAQLPLWKIGLQPLPFGVCQLVPSNYPLHVAHLIGYIRRYLTEFILAMLD